MRNSDLDRSIRSEIIAIRNMTLGVPWREGLIPKIVRQSDANKIREKGLNGPFAEIEFDFAMMPLSKSVVDDPVQRRRVEAA